jgi:aspartyl-tRNA(Asn)/glutamyl-tRNA(Gln) amidotransferase subunit C
VDQTPTLTTDDVRRIARLARLEVTDDQCAAYRADLAAVLGYVQRLRELDLADAEPLTNPGGITNRLAEDEPDDSTRLTPDALLRLAPLAIPPYLAVPRVLED